MSLLIFLVAFLLFILGVPLFVVLGVATSLCLWLIGDIPLVVMAQQMFTTTDSFPLMAIPFFILAGAIMLNGGIARKLIDVAKSTVSWLPGGLGITTILACMFFAAICGSSPATVVSIGMIMFPALIKEKYNENYSLGVITSTGSLGILIPPSIPMIIYAIVVGASVNELFIAGIAPGILIGIILIIYTLVLHIKSSHIRISFNIKDITKKSAEGFWALILPFIILGGIYLGIFTATEAAAVAVVYAFLVEVFIHREIKIKKIPSIFTQSAVDMGTIIIIIAVAVSFSWFLTAQRVPHEIADYIQSHITTKWGFLLMLNLLLIVTGCLMDIISAILILAPLTAPIALKMGIDPIHLGIIFIVNLEIGYLTPPIGINLFVSSVIFEKPIFQVIRSVFPFIILLLLGLIMVTAFPKLSLLLVESYRGR